MVKIRLPLQRTRVQALIPEDPTCLGDLSPSTRVLSPSALESVGHSKRRHRNEKPAHANQGQPPVPAAGEEPAEQLRPSRAQSK